MPTWNKVKLGDIGKVVTGKTPPTKDQSNYGGAYPFICIPDMGNSVFINHTSKTISEEGLATVKNCLIPKYSVMVSCIATIGKVGIAQVPSITNQQINSIIPNVEIANPLFLYYRLKDIKDVLMDFGGGGSVFTNVSKSLFESIEINLPDLPTQTRIASILSLLDDKIELNRQMNHTLEQMAQALFKKYFVDDIDKDNLPVGWSKKTLKEFGNIVCGKTPSKAINEYFNGNTPFIKIPDMHGNAFILETQDSLTDFGANSQKNKYIPAYSLCVSCIATVGLVSITTKPSQTNQQINSIIPSQREFLYFLYFNLLNLKEDLETLGSGGTMALNVNTTLFSHIEIVSAPENILIHFHKTVSPLMERILANYKENQTLSDLRDSLLPKLMSGEVSVEQTAAIT